MPARSAAATSAAATSAAAAPPGSAALWGWPCPPAATRRGGAMPAGVSPAERRSWRQRRPPTPPQTGWECEGPRPAPRRRRRWASWARTRRLAAACPSEQGRQGRRGGSGLGRLEWPKWGWVRGGGRQPCGPCATAWLVGGPGGCGPTVRRGSGRRRRVASGVRRAACASRTVSPPSPPHQACAFVKAARQQHRRLCGVPRHGLHLAGVVRERVLARLGRHVPHLDRLVGCRAWVGGWANRVMTEA